MFFWTLGVLKNKEPMKHDQHRQQACCVVLVLFDVGFLFCFFPSLFMYLDSGFLDREEPCFFPSLFFIFYLWVPNATAGRCCWGVPRVDSLCVQPASSGSVHHLSWCLTVSADVEHPSLSTCRGWPSVAGEYRSMVATVAVEPPRMIGSRLIHVELPRILSFSRPGRRCCRCCRRTACVCARVCARTNRFRPRTYHSRYRPLYSVWFFVRAFSWIR